MWRALRAGNSACRDRVRQRFAATTQIHTIGSTPVPLMNAPPPNWSVNRPCNAALHWLQGRLQHAGLRLLETFDLHDARLATAGCECPHHGTRQCDCHMVVALVYGDTGAPVTLILHGSEGRSWISVIDRPEQPADLGTIMTIRQALESGGLAEG